MTEGTREERSELELDAAARAQREMVRDMTPQERLRLLDRLCRELTHIAVSARRR
jgi:hypothetical protein